MLLSLREGESVTPSRDVKIGLLGIKLGILVGIFKPFTLPEGGRSWLGCDLE